jgi:DNA primase large subunit
MDVPGIEIGFLDNQQEPELFVQDNPTVGSMFTNDKVTYKIRHIYGGNVVEYRGWDKSVVAG